ncbi:MAG: mercury methylation corrinoid protein HgcA [Kiritimatiellae bacterium]|nr:mercury methylation corrinoid protein HgcA [Kiritimatiellia bacterium]
MSFGCCCGTCGAVAVADGMTGYLQTSIGPVPRVAVRWTWRDRVGAWAVCWGLGRMRYTVAPGLYAVGTPTQEAPVLVTANYKLSFDHLRRALDGFDAWVLVLDTKGVNVWCAAGKGTFGTDELVERFALSGVAKVVVHRKLVVPQLGAPGVAAHEVSRRTGFQAIYGPVYARDLPAFLRDGMRATPEMRRVGFKLRERLAVTPIELVHRALPVAFTLAFFLASSGLGRHGYRLDFGQWPWIALAVGANAFAGIVLTPALLPWLPGRSFAVKGAVTGVVLGAILALFCPFGWLAGVSAGMLGVSACSFLGLMFTGCTPYTSASGVKSEMRWSLPMQGALALAGVCGWVASRFI